MNNPSRSEKPKAVVLLSGGLDSATCLAIAQRDGFAPYAMSFRYGQRHAHELAAARAVADDLGVEQHVVVDIGLDQWGGSSLTSDQPVPKEAGTEPGSQGIPSTYVPARNTIFLSLALGWAEVLGARDIYIGVNAIDYSGYPDCRPQFVDAFQRLANVATRVGVEEHHPFRIRTPLLHLTKAEIIREGVALGVDYGKTHSCYDPDGEGRACGRCDSCRLRHRGFIEAGIADPTPYAEPISTKPA